jgi:uncharacterized FlgJ-related protein
MIYRYDKKSLLFKKDFKTIKLSLLFIFLTSAFFFTLGRYVKIQVLDDYERELIIVNLKEEQNKFTEEKFVETLKNLNVRFPHIVMAQSIVETGSWKSRIFKENHNLFGMKQATRRVTTAGGTENNHAYYDNWRESVYDYAFYQCRYLNSVQTEEQYFVYLSKSYAENPDYVSILRKTIETHKLKKYFN